MLKEKTTRRTTFPWYREPEVLIFAGHTEGGSSGAPMVSGTGNSTNYVEALNEGFVRCASWQDGHPFNPKCHFNIGVAVTGNEAF
ncbi:MAG: hypothetical protein OEU36_21930 [Gammaproteobacteria bacterium]|nr:hypothetical protein [Gammaproteobacteria bacterium]